MTILDHPVKAPLVLTLQRDDSEPHCMLGKLHLPSGCVLHTIERPWKNNERGVSCIPAGRYRVRFTMSKRFHCKLYEVMDVPNRSGIRIHAANWATQLEGCIALGVTRGQGLVLQSRIAIQRFHNELAERPFDIVILDPVP